MINLVLKVNFFFFKGFVVSILNTSDQSEDVAVCLACAQAMRGKYRLVKIDPLKKFTCAIGKSKGCYSSSFDKC
jgi:hypothetical protein